MQNDDEQADPLEVSSRELRSAVGGVKASSPASEEPSPQGTVAAHDSACNCTLELLALIYIDELRDGSPTDGRLMENEAEGLVAELRSVRVGETAEVAFIHRNYSKRIRNLRKRVFPALRPPSRKESVDYARGSVRFEGFALSPEVDEIARRYVAEELTLDEFIEAGKAAALKA